MSSKTPMSDELYQRLRDCLLEFDETSEEHGVLGALDQWWVSVSPGEEAPKESFDVDNTISMVGQLRLALSSYADDAPVVATWEGVLCSVHVYHSADGVVLLDADGESYRDRFEKDDVRSKAFDQCADTSAHTFRSGKRLRLGDKAWFEVKRDAGSIRGEGLISGFFWDNALADMRISLGQVNVYGWNGLCGSARTFASSVMACRFAYDELTF